MRQKEVLVASIVGIAMFITDMKFSWLSMYLGTIPGLFVIAFVVGVLATDISGGLLSAFISLVGGVTVSAVFFQYLYPELWSPEATLSGGLMFIVLYSIRNMLPDREVSWVEAITMIVILIVVAPIMYAISIGIGAIGGVVGRFGRKIVEERYFEKPMPSTKPPTGEVPVEMRPAEEPVEVAFTEESSELPPTEDTSFIEGQEDED